MIPISEWKWQGMAGHFICSDRCRYHLTTVVGDYLVSTVGDLHLTPEREMESVAVNPTSYYETMVFKTAEVLVCGCHAATSREIEARYYGNVKCSEVDSGHFDMCMKYAKIQGGKPA